MQWQFLSIMGDVSSVFYLRYVLKVIVRVISLQGQSHDTKLVVLYTCLFDLESYHHFWKVFFSEIKLQKV